VQCSAVPHLHGLRLQCVAVQCRTCMASGVVASASPFLPPDHHVLLPLSPLLAAPRQRVCRQEGCAQAEGRAQAGSLSHLLAASAFSRSSSARLWPAASVAAS
jgi:hypothetical protein